MIIDTHVHVYGFPSLQKLEKEIRCMEDAIGSHRIMFGSDWSATWRWLSDPAPLYDIRMNVLKAASLTDDEREDILWRTADRIFGLGVANQ